MVEELGVKVIQRDFAIDAQSLDDFTARHLAELKERERASRLKGPKSLAKLAKAGLQAQKQREAANRRERDEIRRNELSRNYNIPSYSTRSGFGLW
ncbi:hypothetical protein HY440_01850 [Candidatus Microgenomates bacterium]|nr:hypothetical protein [Candidatus Microgenomates bacterium]